MRTHHGKSAFGNWNWESDAETTELLRKYANLHMKLLPYFYTAAQQASATGLPLMRALALNWPDFAPGWTMTDEYALGDRIVVAPVVTKGATSREVKLPKGDWYPLQGGNKLVSDGVAGQTVQVALDAIAVFVPAGTMLVLLPDNVDTPMDVTAGTGFTSLSAAAWTREIWLWPGAASKQVFDDPFAADPQQFTWDPATWDGTLTAVTWGGEAVQASGNKLELKVTKPSDLKIGAATLHVAAPSGTQLILRFPHLTE